MPIIEPLKDDEIGPALFEQLEQLKGALGTVPNSVRTMARRPEIARAFIDLNQAVMRCEGALTPEFKRIIAYVASFASGCRYCQAHTILASERFGASSARLDAVYDYAESPHFSEAEKAALDFAHAAAQVPNDVTEAHGAALRAHWSEADLVEIMGVVALFGFLNRWNDSMGTALEDLPTEAAERRLAPGGWSIGKHG